MLGKRLLQSLPKILNLTHNPKSNGGKTSHAQSIDYLIGKKKYACRSSEVMAVNGTAHATTVPNPSSSGPLKCYRQLP